MDPGGRGAIPGTSQFDELSGLWQEERSSSRRYFLCGRESVPFTRERS